VKKDKKKKSDILSHIIQGQGKIRIIKWRWRL
jgi:hypothetical protein